MKFKGNLLSLLLSMSFLAALILIFAVPTFASSGASSENIAVSVSGARGLPGGSGSIPPTPGYEISSIPVVSDNEAGAMGTVKLSVAEGQLKDGDMVFFRLPDGLIWSGSRLEEDIPMTDSDWTQFSSLNDNAYGQQLGNYILVPQTFSGEDNALYDVELEVTMLSEREIKVQVIGEPSSGNYACLLIYPKCVWVKEGFFGRVNLEARAPDTSGFPGGIIPIADVSYNWGTVSVNLFSVDTFWKNDEVAFRVTEEYAGCLNPKNDSLVLKLPSGFTWSDLCKVKTVYGDKDFVENGITIKVDEDKLSMDVTSESVWATSFEFKVTINVADRVFARPGVVIVRVSGASNTTPSKLWVGEYNPYDQNGDKATNILDLILVNQLINKTPVGENEKADVNYDGRIDILDLLTVAQNIF